MSPGAAEPDDETRPLLHDGNSPRKATPLPVSQIVVLLLLQLCEPLTSLSIRPYINQVRVVNYHLQKVVQLTSASARQRAPSRWR